MLFLKSWLEEYVDLSQFTDSQISDYLSLCSAECESVEVITEYFDNRVVVGKIENLRTHPDADRLNIFDVNIGNGKKVQIVSAAPNARDGLICPVALDKARLPYLTIIPRKMRGVESQGMCCGMSELALETEYSSGLWELNDLVQETDLGLSVCMALPEFFPAQTIFEIKYLQDKLATCANHLGLAVEIAKITKQPNLFKGFAKTLNSPELLKKELETKINTLKTSSQKLNFEDKTNQTNFFTILSLDTKKVFHLPHLMQTRLFLTGKNMIGGLADLSNYLLFDIGQPSHFFSQSKIIDFNWSIQNTTQTIEFKGLGQLKNAKLPANLPIMVDGLNNTLTIPGVSGSEDTKTDTDETQILIEIANFPKEMIARASSDLNYRSDASKYWASGVNPALTIAYILKLIEILPESQLEVALINKANQNLPLVQYAQELLKPLMINLDLEYICPRLDNRGLYYWTPVIEKLLRGIGELETLTTHKYSFTPSPFFNSLGNQEDVLFELTKLVGIDKLSPEYLTFDVSSKSPTYYTQINNIKTIFTDFGFSEVMTRPFLPQNKLLSSLTGAKSQALVALSSQRKDEPYLRDSLFSSLLEVVNSNIKVGGKEPKLFEASKVYLHSDNQTTLLSQSLDQTKVWEHFVIAGFAVTKGPYLCTSLIHKIQTKTKLEFRIEELDSEFQKIGKGYSYNLENNIQISLVEVNNSIKKQFDLPITKTVWYIEMKYNPALLEVNQYQKFQDLTSYPVITRSYSYIVPKTLQWSKVTDIAGELSIPETKISLLPVERISNEDTDILNFNIEYFSYSRTLTGTEIEKYESDLLDNIQECEPSIRIR